MACAMGTSAAKADGGELWVGGAGGPTYDGLLNTFNLSGVTAIAAGSNFTMVLQNGVIYTWGDNMVGQLGRGTGLVPYDGTAARPLDNPPSGTVTAIAAGGTTSFAIMNGGSLYAWGSNGYGQLGTGFSDYNPHDTPTPVQDLSSGVTAVAVGWTYCMAIKDGGVWSWGTNANGDRYTPTPMSTLSSGITAIAAGASHGVALDNAGEVWIWGSNADGSGAINTPELVTGLGTVIAIAAGGDATLAVTTNGDVWGWGENFGTSPIDLTLNVYHDLTNVVDVAIGWDNSYGGSRYTFYALTGTGDLYEWTSDVGSVPTLQGDPGDVFAKIVANGTHALAIKNWAVDTPEPGSLGLLTIGVVGLLMRRRSRA